MKRGSRGERGWGGEGVPAREPATFGKDAPTLHLEAGSRAIAVAGVAMRRADWSINFVPRTGRPLLVRRVATSLLTP
jgi:hypothetical protein